jgi:hypothetical protein
MGLAFIRRICFYLGIALLPFMAMAQQGPVVKTEEQTRFVYKKEWAGGFSISNRGLGGNLRYSIVPGNFIKTMFELEVAKIRHPKEVKIVNPFYSNSKSYVYGKENSFFAVRTGIGSQFLIFDKAPKEGVEVSFVAMGGASWGVLKPIYLEIIQDNINPFDPIIVSERFDKNRHNPSNILGYSGFNKGLSELGLIPGLYLKSGLSFDWSVRDDKVLSLEAGTVVDYYAKPVPIMAEFDNIKNQRLFLSLYVTVLFGKKY